MTVHNCDEAQARDVLRASCEVVLWADAIEGGGKRRHVTISEEDLKLIMQRCLGDFDSTVEDMRAMAIRSYNANIGRLRPASSYYVGPLGVQDGLTYDPRTGRYNTNHN